MKKTILNPNCSEIVCRLFGEKIDIFTDSFPNGAFESFLSVLKRNKDKDFPEEPEFVENAGGGGHWDYVKDVYKIAIEVAKGSMMEENGLINEERISDGKRPIYKCDICGKKPNLKKDKIKICLRCEKIMCPECIDKKMELEDKTFCCKECKDDYVVDKL